MVFAMPGLAVKSSSSLLSSTPVPSSESWWDVPVSEVAQLDSTRQARKTYEAHKAEQRPLLTPVPEENTS